MQKTLGSVFVGMTLLAAACIDDSSSGTAAFDGGTLDATPTDGGSDATQSTPGTAPKAGDGTIFCDQTLGMIGTALAACCTATDKASSDYDFVNGIVTSLLPRCRSVMEASISLGRLTVHEQERKACVDAYAARYATTACQNITTTFSDPAGDTCHRAFSGTSKEGGPCAGDHECEDGLTCVGHTTTSDGVCKREPAISADCGPTRTDGGSLAGLVGLEFGTHPSCAAGAYCDEGTCVASRAAGADCELDMQCSPLRCLAGKCENGEPRDVGGACVQENDCKGGLYCNVDQCAAKLSAGGSCTGAFGVAPECKGRCDADPTQAGTCVTFCGSE